MKIYNVNAAGTHLSRLIEEAAAGEEVVIARAGKPVAAAAVRDAGRAAPAGPAQGQDLDGRRLRRSSARGDHGGVPGRAPVRCLLDAHVLLWWIEDDSKLAPALRAIIADPGNEVAVSTATVWEAVTKRALGKLRFDTATLLDSLRRGNMSILPISAAHALATGDLPRHHDDPFDRMLVAQAITESFTLITSDRRLRSYAVAVVEA
jgi:PIN domain nuclease of toxin-antitoxin system/antitoxin (DNA-binding transcriptional repressor) of toxin-antitoxin stability system